MAQNIRPRPGQATPTPSNMLDPAVVVEQMERYYGSDLKSYGERIVLYPPGGVKSSIDLLLRRGQTEPDSRPPALLIRGVEGGGVILVYWDGKLVFSTTEQPNEQKVELPPDQLGKLFDGKLDVNLSKRLNLLPHLPAVVFGQMREHLTAGNPRLQAWKLETPGLAALQVDRGDGKPTVYIVVSDTGQLRRITQTTPLGELVVDIPPGPFRDPVLKVDVSNPQRNPILKDELFVTQLPSARPTPTRPSAKRTPSAKPTKTPLSGGTPVETSEPGATPTDTEIPGTPAAPTPVPLVGGKLLDKHPLLGQLAPDFTYPTIQATQGHLFDHLGRVVLIVFWDSSFPSAEELLTGLKSFAQQQPPGTVQVFAINVRQEVTASMEMLAKLNDPRVTCIMDAARNSAYEQYSALSVPMVFVLDPTLNVRAVYTGWQADSLPTILQAIAPYLPKPPATQP